MGLFSKKASCPICGGKISFFLPTKIQGEQICDDCAGKIDIQNDIKNSLTMQEFMEYLTFYEQNKILKDRFIVSQKLDFGCFDTKMVFDFENKMFCMSKNPDKTVFQGTQLKRFTIKEDNSPLFEGIPNGLKRYTSTVPDKIMALAPQISQFVMNKRLVDAIERMDDDDDRRSYHPYMDIPEPFQEFEVELYMEHPYWSVIKCDMSAPTFSNSYPDANDYMREYAEGVEVMEQLAQALMQVAFPGKGEISASSQPTAAFGNVQRAPQGDAIDEIKRYKALMEEGIITKEEFEAKKKAILGI